MSTEKETLHRVQEGLFHLQRGISPIVENRMKAKHGQNWLHYASRAMGSQPNAKLDLYGNLKTILDQWRDVFEQAFDRKTGQKFRTLVSLAFEGRNATSHLT